MANKQSASNQFVRALLTLVGEHRDLIVLGIIPSHLQGKKIKATLLAEFDNTCAYCDARIEVATCDIDHVVPMNKASLGLHMMGNLVPSCKPCNAAKHSKSLDEFAVAHPELVTSQRVATLTERAKSLGADLDTQALREFVESSYSSIGELIETKKADALRLLPQPSKAVKARSLEFITKAEFDFSEIANAFPLGAIVRATMDGKSGVVVDYSLQGPKGKRTPYVTFQESPDSPGIRRSPNHLEVIRLR
jgi:hypothetical protein